MLRVDELLDRLGTARIYSTLDLTKGYWQIPLSPLSKEKSAFATPFGLHQFVTLPFGLFGAPTTFQRLMDKILRPLGAVLTQDIGGEERPVLYISRKLSKRETIYNTIEKECLAIRWVVLTLRYYLLGREFTLCSDHAPLQWLQPFKFKVIHRPGTQMTVVDFLSRNGGGGCRPEGYVARGAWFSEVCSGRKTQETAVSKWVKCKMRNICV